MRESAAITGGVAQRATKRGSAGFTLAELAIGMLIIGLLLFVLLPTTTVMRSNSNRTATQQKLANIDTALVNFVIVNKRLPCPADGALQTGTEIRDGATGDCTGNQARGVVPWTTLGMGANDILDAWNNRVTYRVGWGLTRANALDMSSCDPAGTATASPAMNGAVGTINTGVCAATCTGTFAAANCTSPQSFLAFKGLDVKTGTAATTKVMDYTATTAAAYILISHGDNAYGSYSSLGAYQTPSAGWTTAAAAGSGTLENPNWNLAALTVTGNAPPVLVDASFSESAGRADLVTTTAAYQAHFDDIVSRPLLFSVISRAQLGPRAH